MIRINEFLIYNIRQTTARFHAGILSDGGKEITARGICWNSTGNPTIIDYTTYNGSGTGSFSGTLDGLTPETTYFIRIFLITSEGIIYGEK